MHVEYALHEGTVTIFLVGPLSVLRPILFRVVLVALPPSRILKASLRFVATVRRVDHRLENLLQGLSCLTPSSDKATLRSLLRLQRLDVWHRHFHLATLTVLVRGGPPFAQASRAFANAELERVLLKFADFRLQACTFVRLGGAGGFLALQVVMLAANAGTLYLGFFDVDKPLRAHQVNALRDQLHQGPFEIMDRPLAQLLHMRDRPPPPQQGLTLLEEYLYYGHAKPSAYFCLVPYPQLTASLFFRHESFHQFDKPRLAHEFRRVLLERRTKADGFVAIERLDETNWLFIRELAGPSRRKVLLQCEVSLHQRGVRVLLLQER